jgi:hypothetical protein
MCRYFRRTTLGLFCCPRAACGIPAHPSSRCRRSRSRQRNFAGPAPKRRHGATPPRVSSTAEDARARMHQTAASGSGDADCSPGPAGGHRAGAHQRLERGCPWHETPVCVTPLGRERVPLAHRHRVRPAWRNSRIFSGPVGRQHALHGRQALRRAEREAAGTAKVKAPKIKRTGHPLHIGNPMHFELESITPHGLMSSTPALRPARGGF